MLNLLRKRWFYTLTLIHALFDLGALLYGISLWVALVRHPDVFSLDNNVNAIMKKIWVTLFVGRDLFLCFGILNGIYLSTYGYLRTNSILGSFVFQQIATTVLILLALVLYIGRKHGAGGYDYYSTPWKSGAYDFILCFVSLILHALSSFTLWYLFFAARYTKDNLLGRWTVDVGDLVTGMRVLSDGPSWRGAKRPGISEESYRGRTAKAIVAFIPNALFRRVPEVETKPYALFQHSFALAAIALLLTRAATLLTQLGNENLPSRTVVDVCSADVETLVPANFSVVVRYPELAGVNNTLNPGDVNLRHVVSVGYQETEPASWYNPTIMPCTPANVQKVDPGPSGPNVTDWLHIFRCNGLNAQSGRLLNTRAEGFIQYAISTSDQTNTSNIGISNEHMPSLWLGLDLSSNYMLTPYAVPPIRPIFRTNAYFETRLVQRKYISSSPFRDAVTGSKPEYSTTDLYPWSQMYSQQIPPPNGSNTTPHTTGYIRLPGHINPFIQTPRSMLKEGVRGPEDLCEIVEEYRTGSTFDILASIGGLLALLQGLHVFLFGRPLFWGLFGAKIITPFGIFGRLATKGFRGRLKSRYDPDSLSNQEREGIKQETMLMTRFLLDYVVDLGPAQWPAETQPQVQTPEQINLLEVQTNIPPVAVRDSQELDERQMS